MLINCTLKASPEKSNTEALAEVVAEALRADRVEVASVRVADRSVPRAWKQKWGRAVARALEAKPIPAPPSE